MTASRNSFSSRSAQAVALLEAIKKMVDQSAVGGGLKINRGFAPPDASYDRKLRSLSAWSRMLKLCAPASVSGFVRTGLDSTLPAGFHSP
jgi:hypothetical protein